MQKFVIAFYIRLSLEDTKTESMSIPNQRAILREHAMSLAEWDRAEVLEFVDNGHSGANFERPAVQELLEMVQAGKIDCIMVKDLSRFGRNSIETGYFIERVFPLYHTRLSLSVMILTPSISREIPGALMWPLSILSVSATAGICRSRRKPPNTQKCSAASTRARFAPMGTGKARMDVWRLTRMWLKLSA